MLINNSEEALKDSPGLNNREWIETHQLVKR